MNSVSDFDQMTEFISSVVCSDLNDANHSIGSHLIQSHHLEQDIDLFLADLPQELIALSYSSQFDPSLVFRREEPILWSSSDPTSDDDYSAAYSTILRDIQAGKAA